MDISTAPKEEVACDTLGKTRATATNKITEIFSDFKFIFLLPQNNLPHYLHCHEQYTANEYLFFVIHVPR